MIPFVLPAFNEGEHIKESIRRLNSSFSNDHPQHESLVVDDESVGDTLLKVIELPRGIKKQYYRGF